MAIKLPDPGNGIPEQKTGNDEWTNMKIVRDNFADQSNAASRIVGDAPGQVVTVNGSTGLNLTGWGGVMGRALSGNADRANITFSGIYRTNSNEINFMPQYSPAIVAVSSDTFMTITGSQSNGDIVVSAGRVADLKNPSATLKTSTLYSTSNTTTDSNKNIKTSSPVVRVFNDRLDKIHEANDLPIKYTRNGVGDYTIDGTTGLRENDWQIVIPKDDHDNQLIAFTIEDNNGTIHLRTYKRIFSMETFTFGPDLNTPLDIPEGRWVDLHFNDLPEQTDEPAI